jgi:hypothetical protein
MRPDLNSGFRVSQPARDYFFRPCADGANSVFERGRLRWEIFLRSASEILKSGQKCAYVHVECLLALTESGRGNIGGLAKPRG